MVTKAEIDTICSDTIRFVPSNSQQITDDINNGVYTVAQFVNSISYDPGEKCTEPALDINVMFNGVTPSSATLTSHAGFCRTQWNYYNSLGVADPWIGPYEALGRAHANTSQFATWKSGLTQNQMWQKAATFCGSGTLVQAQLNHWNAQYSYFYNLYVNAGIPAGQAQLEAEGAVVGQIVGAYVRSGSSPSLRNKYLFWFFEAADGNPVYNGTY